MKWFLKALIHYFDFSGRASRKEYWMFILFYYVFVILVAILDYILETEGEFYIIYSWVMFIPGLAVSVRRLHDVGKSGSMLIIIIIQIVGVIWLLVLLVTDSVPSENQYGPNPKETTVKNNKNQIPKINAFGN